MKKCFLFIAIIFAGLSTFAGTTLSVPDLVAPANNAIKQAPNVLLNWNPVSGNIGLYYEVQLDTSNTFSNPIILQTEFSSVQPSQLLFATKYYWHVRAVDPSGASDWSETRSFTVVITVALVDPAANATKQMPNAEIKWTAITGLTGTIGVNFYEYQLDTLSTFNSPYSSTVSVPGSVNRTNLHNLYFNTKYYWRMRAINGNDTTIWSAFRAFTTFNSITLKTPANLVVDQSPVIELKWSCLTGGEVITGLSKYIVSIADNPDFNFSIIRSVALTNNADFSINSDTLEFGKTYYWKVQGVHPLDVVSSEVRSFTTLNSVVLTAPADSLYGVGTIPTFSWEAIEGSVYYDLWLSSEASFLESTTKKYKVTNSNPATGPQKYTLPANILKPEDVCFWKVRAVTVVDTSNWSDAWFFHVNTNGLDDISAAGSTIMAYPNPARDKICLLIPFTKHTILQLSISNLIGNTLISDEVQFANGRSVNDIDVKCLPNGVYFVKIQKESTVYMSKLIIDK
jgi:hypothetical protein